MAALSPEALAGLSPTMRNALRTMNESGGLKRLPGGFWIRASAAGLHGEVTFGTTTVEALVRRRRASYTEWKGDPKFPIKAEVRT